MGNDKAVFLDRDGVLNELVWNIKSNEFEAPHKSSDYKLLPGVIDSLKELLNLNYKLFVVTNQPDYAKGKTTLEDLKLVHEKMHSIFKENNVNITEYYYCYHHPQGIVPAYSIACECRKPGNLSLRQASLKYGLDMANSWMIGDRDGDIECGQASCVRTIMIKVEQSLKNAMKSRPDYKVNNLQEAVEIIKKELSYAKR